MLKHRSFYVIYAPYIQKIINSKTDLEFHSDGDHGPYQPQLVRAPHLSSPPADDVVVATAPTGARVPPTRGHAPSSAPESSRATTRRGKKQNILLKGLKTLISMCRSNDTLIRESHQQMSQTLAHLEESQCEMHTSMGLANPEPTIYPPLPPPTMEDPWAWYRNDDDGYDDDDVDEADDEDQEELSEDLVFPSLFLVLDTKGEKKFYLARFMSLVCSSLRL
jgi:hypothetical protein